MKKQLKNISKREDGAALVLVMMIFLVLSTLGLMVGTLTVGSHRLSHNSQKYNSAYYIAEAGANMAYEELAKSIKFANEKTNKNSTSFFATVNSTRNSINDRKPYHVFDKQFGENPSVTVKITDKTINSNDENKEYTIKSTGNVSGKIRIVEKKVEVNWINDTPNGALPEVPKGTSVIAKDSIKYLGGSITGDVYLDSKEKQSFSISNQWSNVPGNIYTSYSDMYNFREIYKGVGNNADSRINSYVINTTPSTYNFNWNSYDNYINKINSDFESIPMMNTNFTNNGAWKDFDLQNKEIKSNDVLFQGSIKLNVGDSESIIVTNNFTQSWGDTQIIGDGSLTIFVLDTVTFNGPLNTNGGNLRIVFPHINQNITVINGARVTAQIIAPYSEVTLVNTNIIGNVIAKIFHSSNGGGEIKPFNFDFLKNSNETNNESDKKLISPKPAIEQ